MLKYIAKRLLIALPTLFIILLISFLISRSVPGDPVFREMDTQFREGSMVSAARRNEEYLRISHQKGLDLPVFYMELSAIAYPDTLHRIPILGDRENWAEMIALTGNWPQISHYAQQVEAALNRMRGLQFPSQQKTDLQSAQRALEELKMVSTAQEAQYRLDLLDTLRLQVPTLNDSVGAELTNIAAAFAAVQSETSIWKLYVPTLYFHGFSNQFHVWMSQVLRLDFGRSYTSKRQVSTMIAESAPWSMLLGFLGFVISYLIAIPVGVYAVQKRNRWQDQSITVGLFLLHSVPTFVAAMLVMTFFCNPDYLQLFPTSGLLSDGAEQWPWIYRMSDYAYHLVLPTLIYSYGGIAFVSRQMRNGMLETVNLDYIRTARAKGLPERIVIWRHAVRNSLLPIVTHLANLLPSMIAGAVIVETIFSVPGMGQLSIEALGTFDHPVIIATLTLTTLATLLGFLLTDILYAAVDPRISFDK